MDILWGVLGNLHFNATTFVFQLVAFVVFHFAMRAIIYDRLISVRNSRDGRIEAGLAKAKAAADQAQSLKADYDTKMKTLRNDLKSKVDSARAVAEAESKERTEAARKQAAEILEQAQIEVAAEQAKAEEELGRRSADLARSISRRLVEQNFSSSAQADVLSGLGV